jgi:hypothetical protein
LGRLAAHQAKHSLISFSGMKRYYWLAIGLVASLQWGCQKAHESSEGARAIQANMLMDAPPMDVTVAPVEALAQDSVTVSAQPTIVTRAARLLVYHAEVRLKASRMSRAMTQLDSLVQRSGGYLSAAAETRADGEWRQTTTIRVPPAQFRVLLSGLAGLGTIEEKKLSTDDVTAEHADVAARLQTKRTIERQYTALLAKAQKIKDILDIEAKLGEVREDIESTESRLKTLNNQVAYSTIELMLYQPLPQSIPDAPVVSLGSRVVEAFYDGWQLLTSLLVGAINLWPLLLLVAGGWGLWRRRARRVAAPRPPAPKSAS